MVARYSVVTPSTPSIIMLFCTIEYNYYITIASQGWLNSLKVVGAQLTSKTHFYCEILNCYEQF